MKTTPIRKIPILPEHWATRPDVRMLYGPTYSIEASKTCTEEWSIVFLIADGHHVAYRLKVNESYGYGG
jgi:hypothetical protein